MIETDPTGRRFIRVVLVALGVSCFAYAISTSSQAFDKRARDPHPAADQPSTSEAAGALPEGRDFGFRPARPGQNSLQPSETVRFANVSNDYQIDDGSLENSIGTDVAGVAITWYVNYTLIGGFPTIQSVNPDAGSVFGACNGLTVSVAVLDDPNGDGDPDDAEICGSIATAELVNAGSANPQKVALAGPANLNTCITNLNGSFFVAASLVQTAACGFPVPADQTAPIPLTSWLGVGALSACPFAAGGGGAGCIVDCVSENCCIGCDSNWFLRANAGPPILPDCDGDGVPDDEEIANCSGDQACADCNGNLIPDGCDIADCNPMVDPACDDCNLNSIPDGCDIADLTSDDDDMNGVPDECAIFVGGCSGASESLWSCPENWLLDDPGDDYPDNVAFGGPFHVLLDGVDEVFLDVSALINTLLLRENSTLHVVPIGPGPGAADELIITDEGGAELNADLLVSGDSAIDASGGEVTIGAGGYYGPDPEAVGAVTASLVAGSLEILEGPAGLAGTMDLSGGMEVSVLGGAVLIGIDDNCTPPILRTNGNAAMAVAGEFEIRGSAEIAYASTEPLVLGGDFENSSTAPEIFDWLDGALCMGSCASASAGAEPARRSGRIQSPASGPGAADAAAGPPAGQTFEVAGQDLGVVNSGLINNFAIGALTISTGAEVTFVDAFDNDSQGQSSCTEALYLGTLVLEAGCTITLDDVNVYYVELLDAGATVNAPGCGALLAAFDCEEPCSDGDACTDGDTCVNHVCAGTPLDCDDGNPCTADSCDSQDGCVNACLAPATPCDAGGGPGSGACGDLCTCVAVGMACPGGSVQECADLNGDDIRDDNCVWWACVDGECQATPIPFSDMGGSFGACAPDLSTDINDRFHALNCFGNQDTSGAPPYSCEASPPAAFNVDGGGSFGACASDGVCDGNDAFHAINTFAGTSTCTCAGPAPGPGAPAQDGGNPETGSGENPGTGSGFAVTPSGFTAKAVPVPVSGAHRAVLELSASTQPLAPGRFVEVDVYLASPLPDLRGYQLHLGASGGSSGALELVDILIREPGVFSAGGGFVAADVSSAVRDGGRAAQRDEIYAPGAWSAFNIDTRQMLAGLDSPGVTAPAGSYLATFVYRVSKDARGAFAVELLADPNDPAQRTFLFPTAVDARIEIAPAAPARIVVLQGRN